MLKQTIHFPAYPKSHHCPQANQENTMRLHQNQLCPIHRSRFCCGREAIPRERRQHHMGVRRIEDPHHPRGYRELRSNGEMRKLLDRKISAQRGKCALCNEPFTDYGDIVPDHRRAATWKLRKENYQFPSWSICSLCEELFTDYGDIVPDQISPRCMGGTWRDDHPENIQAVHW